MYRARVVALIVLGAAATILIQRELRPHRAVPPDVPAGLADPVVIAAMTDARAAVLDDPGSGAAWGVLAMVFFAHDSLPEAGICFTEAARLQPENPAWS